MAQEQDAALATNDGDDASAATAVVVTTTSTTASATTTTTAPSTRAKTRSLSAATGVQRLVEQEQAQVDAQTHARVEAASALDEDGFVHVDAPTISSVAVAGAAAVARSPASERSSESFDSAPSITAIERAVIEAPGATTERPDFTAAAVEPAAPDATATAVPTGGSASPTTTSTSSASVSVPPPLERSKTSGELISIRQREIRAADDTGYANAIQSVEIESVTLPTDGITETEIEKAMHTVFAVEVRLRGGLQWIIKKRYSDFRELHDRLKRTNSSVKQLHFPKRHVFRNRHTNVIEQRRSELEKYINDALEIRPLIRLPLFNFLEVYVHMESYERKLERYKKEQESERMKNLLDPELLEDLSTAFKRLCSSKYLYHGGPQQDADGNPTTTTTTSTPPAAANGTANRTPNASPTSPPKETAKPAEDKSPAAGAAAGTTQPSATAPLYVSRTCFRRDILGAFPDIPSSFATRFMKAMSDRQGLDITMDEFLRAIAVLKRGSVEDKLRFVYNMCDLDHTGKVQSTGLSNFLSSLNARQLDRHEYRVAISNAFDEGRLRMNQAEFVSTMIEQNATSILLSWMDPFVEVLCETPDPHLLESQEEFNPVVQQKILAAETHFNVREVSLLVDAFNNYRASGGGDSVDLDALTNDFPLEMTETLVHRVFSSFGPRANGTEIDVFSFVSVLSIACRGSVEEKAEFAFKMFATVKGGELMSRDDLFGMLRMDLAQNSELERLVTGYVEKTKKSINIRTLKSLGENGPQTPSVSGSQLGIFVDAMMKEHGQLRPASGDGFHGHFLAFDEFLSWTTSEHYEMIALRIMREVSFIDLGLVPSNKEEELLVAKTCYKPYDPSALVEDDVWYLLEKKWFDHWCNYVGFHAALHLPATKEAASSGDTSKTSNGTRGKEQAPTKDAALLDSEGNYVKPKCISNQPLVSERHVLKSKDDIKLGVHFVVLSEQMWLGLKLWYGGTPEIRRKVILRPDGSCVLDIWGDEIEKTTKDSEDDTSEDGAVPAPADELATKKTAKLTLPRRMRTGGSAGLSNLGNTCYMASALQCLTNTQLLAEYFLSGMYLDDINRTSTLGLQGKLAEVYGRLAEDMWCAKQRSVSPRNFKKTIGRFNEAFRGNDQQDAQELLSFLLSGLSEDLNRIQDKPYVEQPDSDGRFDSDLADEWWRNHLRREVSIIVALFTGQYKSLLTCSECGFKSARFEPFTFLQVPLPEPTHNTVTLVFVLSNGMTPTKVSVRLGISATIYDLKHELVGLCHNDFDLPNITESDIKICEYSGSMILSFKADSRRVGQIRSIERLIAFQLEPLDADTIHATRHRRPSYVPPTAGVRTEDIEAEKNLQSFYQSVTTGTLVEVRIRGQSMDPVPGVIVECPAPQETTVAKDEDEVDDPLYTIQLQRGQETIQVHLSELRPRQPRLLYIPLLSRKLAYSALYFKNPFRPAPFGTPNLVRICPELTSGLDLYRLVWRRVRGYMDGREPRLWNEAELAEKDQLLSNRIHHVFTGLTAVCGFVLRRVDNKGLSDSRVRWLTRSFGQVIPCTNDPLDIMEEETIAIDWDLEVFQSRESLERMRHIEPHTSVEKNDAIDKGPVPLRHCLDSFTSEEKISEGYCSSCREHLEMTKKLEIWRLPPIMVIQLKRFQYTQAYRRKLASLVEFPMRGLDLACCVAPHIDRPERYPMKKPKPRSESQQDEEDSDSDSKDGATKKSDSSGGSGTTDASRKKSDAKAATKERTTSSSGHSGPRLGRVESDTRAAKPKPPPVANRVRRGYTNTNLELSRCLETHYDLYGVVNHQGALGGGHYTAYAKSFLDDQWYFYDDERVRVVEESKIVSASAYLLFYVRSDMHGMLVKDLYPVNTNKTITDEDINRFVQEDDRRCKVM